MQQFMEVVRFEIRMAYRNVSKLQLAFMVLFMLGAIILYAYQLDKSLNDNISNHNFGRVGIVSEVSLGQNFWFGQFDNISSYDSLEKMKRDIKNGDLDIGIYSFNENVCLYSSSFMYVKQIQAVMANQGMDVNKITFEKIEDKGLLLPRIFAILFVIPLMSSLMGQTIALANQIAHEKHLRATEVLLSIVDSRKLYYSKVISSTLMAIIEVIFVVCLVLMSFFVIKLSLPDLYTILIDDLVKVPHRL